jgi:hypothetical protein
LAARPMTTYCGASAFRERSQTTRMSEALFGREDPHTHAPLHTFRRRSQTHAWAKPCLAGRPTMLVRTQPPEQNTSRGRPPGMELPDYPVVVLTPTPWDQDGPALHYPAGSFPGFVSRSASRRVFFQIRSSLFFPPGLFLGNSYLVLLPTLPTSYNFDEILFVEPE